MNSSGITSIVVSPIALLPTGCWAKDRYLTFMRLVSLNAYSISTRKHDLLYRYETRLKCCRPITCACSSSYRRTKQV